MNLVRLFFLDTYLETLCTYYYYTSECAFELLFIPFISARVLILDIEFAASSSSSSSISAKNKKYFADCASDFLDPTAPLKNDPAT